MENIYRFKKRMVYPEKLILDQIDNRLSTTKVVRGWCSGAMETRATSAKSLPDKDSYATSSNGQFIQDRIRHLVEAFSTRAEFAKEHIETPATLSSVSSRETLEPSVVTTYKPKPASRTEDSTCSLPADNRSASVYENLNYLLKTKTIDPNGSVYIVWMSLAALSVMYNVWVIPLRGTFPYQNKNNRHIWMCFDYLADFIYFLDMILIQPRIKYLSDGFWVTDMASLRYNYARTRAFKLDLLALAPLDILYVVLGPECVMLRFPRFFKLHTFWEFFSFIDKLLANPYIIRITRTLMYMMYLIHLNACAYYAFSSWQGIGSNNFVYDGRNNAYIKCFYFATKTATSIGKNPKPTHEIEYMFMTVSWLMGVFVFALLIGQIRDIISTATRSKTEYRKLVDETLEYMRRLNLPQDMQRRVQLWFNYTWETQRTLDENYIMDCLPHKMKTDIAINVHYQTLSKVKLFADCDEALLRELVLQLKSVIYLPGDIICKKGDVGKEMYIVQSGKVQVIGRHATDVLATLSEGSVFGEISLLGIPGKNRRTADVMSHGHSNLFVLSKADLNDALANYPEAQELLNKKAKLLMKKNAALERKQNAMIVIDNPSPPPKQAKLLETVLQVVPANSRTNQLLRFGSRCKPRHPENERFKYRNSLPMVKHPVDKTFQASVTVHRSMT